jgi:hypothetical protein
LTSCGGKENPAQTRVRQSVSEASGGEPPAPLDHPAPRIAASSFSGTEEAVAEERGPHAKIVRRPLKSLNSWKKKLVFASHCFGFSSLGL